MCPHLTQRLPVMFRSTFLLDTTILFAGSGCRLVPAHSSCITLSSSYFFLFFLLFSSYSCEPRSGPGSALLTLTRDCGVWSGAVDEMLCPPCGVVSGGLWAGHVSPPDPVASSLGRWLRFWSTLLLDTKILFAGSGCGLCSLLAHYSFFLLCLSLFPAFFILFL